VCHCGDKTIDLKTTDRMYIYIYSIETDDEEEEEEEEEGYVG
jgi:hypothetical protein